MSDMKRHPLNKLSSLLFYDMLEMREAMKERIVRKMKDEATSTGEVIEMMDSLLAIHEVVDKEVKGRLAGESRARTFGLDYRK